MSAPKPLFTLPAEPVDQYLLEWWEVDIHPDVPRLVRHALQYHVSTPFEVANPRAEADRPGQPIVDQWLCFTRYHDDDAPWTWYDVTGRTGGGWQLGWKWDRRCFATRVAALKHLIEVATNARRAQREVEEQLSDALAEFESRLLAAEEAQLAPPPVAFPSTADGARAAVAWLKATGHHKCLENPSEPGSGIRAVTLANRLRAKALR